MTTLSELPPAAIEEQNVQISEAVAYGLGGMIVRSPADPGYCYKVSNAYGPDLAMSELTREAQIHDVLIELGIPTIDTFELRSVTRLHNGLRLTVPCARMTDLAADGSLVLSTADAFHANMREGGQEHDFYHAISQRPVYNVTEFFDQLKDIVARASAAIGSVAGVDIRRLRIGVGGFFLVVHPNGTLETRIGDYHDGVEIYSSTDSVAFDIDSPQAIGAHFARHVTRYLEMVIRVLPALEDGAKEFITSNFPGQPSHW